MQDIIEKMQKLKSYSRRVTTDILTCNTLQHISYDYVGITGLTRGDIFDRVEKASKCCDIVEIKEFIPANGTGQSEYKISNGNYCNTPAICPICATTKQAKQRRSLSDSIANACKSYQYVYMLTFTVAPDSNLNRQMNHIKRSFTRWRKMGQIRRIYKTKNGHRVKVKEYYDYGEYGKVRAGFLSWEIKRGTGSGNWHAHAHALLWADEPLDYSIYAPMLKRELTRQHGCKRFSDLPPDIKAKAIEPHSMENFNGRSVPLSKVQKEWFAATGDSIHLDARLVGYNTGKGMAFYKKDKEKSRTQKKNIYYPVYCKSEKDYFKGIFKTSFEVLTYYSKLVENPADDAVKILDQTHSFKFFSSFRNMRKSEIEPEQRTAAAVWSIRHESNQYGKPHRENGEIIRNMNECIKDGFLKKAAQIQGAYRSNRNAIFKTHYKKCDNLAAWLDQTKQQFKNEMSILWSNYTRSKLTDAIESINIRREAETRKAYLESIGIQVSFGF